jgi:hypothetical protein
MKTGTSMRMVSGIFHTRSQSDTHPQSHPQSHPHTHTRTQPHTRSQSRTRSDQSGGFIAL